MRRVTTYRWITMTSWRTTRP